MSALSVHLTELKSSYRIHALSYKCAHMTHQQGSCDLCSADDWHHYCTIQTSLGCVQCQSLHIYFSPPRETACCSGWGGGVHSEPALPEAFRRILQGTTWASTSSPTSLFNEPRLLPLTQPPQKRSTHIKSARKKKEESGSPLLLHKPLRPNPSPPPDCGQMLPYDPLHVGLMHCVTAVAAR